MAPNHEEIRVSVDLHLTCKNYVDRMKRQMSSPDLLRPDVIRAALYRYQHFWLPLVAKYPDEDFVAPEDIEWVWHCHMLNPVSYDRDCEMLVGRFIGNEALMRSDDEKEKALQRSRRLWDEAYPPAHPFYVDIGGPVRPEYRTGNTNFNSDFLAVAKRQMEFAYQVSLPHYQDPKFLASAVDRYKKFLHLASMYPDHCVIPTLDVDFVWHSHQLCPSQYRAEMKAIVGWVLDHGKVPPGWPMDAKVNFPDQFTIDAWNKEFGDAISVFGGNYRGGNSVGLLDTVNKEKLALLTSSHVKVIITDITLKAKHHLDEKIVLQLETALEKYKIVLQLQEKGDDPNGFRYHALLEKESVSFRVDSSMSNNYVHEIRFIKTASQGSGNRNIESRRRLDGTSFLISPPTIASDYIQTVLFLDDMSKLEIRAIKKPLTHREGTALSIQPGRNKELDMTESLKTMLWGPTPLSQQPLETDYVRINAVSFGLVNCQEQETFTCNQFDCRHLDTEATQILFCGQMVAVAHLIDDTQLPHPSQVSNTEVAPVVDSHRGEQAALIMNSQGDWGVLVARMVEEKPLSGVTGSKKVREFLDLTLWILGSSRKFEFRMPDERNEYKLSLDGVTVNFSTGFAKIAHPNTPVAECLAMAFMVKILWRLCRTTYIRGSGPVLIETSQILMNNHIGREEK